MEAKIIEWSKKERIKAKQIGNTIYKTQQNGLETLIIKQSKNKLFKSNTEWKL
jgi:hypothetical protein